MDELNKRGFHLARKRPFCGKSEETLEHIMIHYPLIWDLWAIIFATFKTIEVRSFLVRHFLSRWGSGPDGKYLRFLREIPPSLLWATWKEKKKTKLCLKIPLSPWSN